MRHLKKNKLRITTRVSILLKPPKHDDFIIILKFLTKQNVYITIFFNLRPDFCTVMKTGAA